MLANPMNNQDMLQRSEIVSDQRNHEHNKVMGELGHAADHMRKKEVLKESTVQQTESMQLNPDGEQEKQSQQHPRREKSTQDAEEPHPHPRQLTGGDHLDIIA